MLKGKKFDAFTLTLLASVRYYPIYFGLQKYIFYSRKEKK